MSTATEYRQHWIPLFTAVLSVVSALGVAYLALQTKTVETTVKRDEIALQQSQFDAEQRRRAEETLLAIIPKISSSDPQLVREGMISLTLLLPDRVPEVQAALNTTLNETQRRAMQPVLSQVQRLAAGAGPWGIVAGGDRGLEDARHEAERAANLGYTPTIYHKDDWYRTVLGPFPTQTDAERANIDVRARFRASAYVTDLGRWCGNASPAEGYVEC